MNHRSVRRSLYDFVRNELGEDERRLVQQHLDLCPSCRRELRELEQALNAFSPATSDPAALRDEGFWNELAQNVEREIARTDARHHGRLHGVIEQVRTWIAFRPAYAGAAGALFALLIAAVIFLVQPASEERLTVERVRPSEEAMVQEDPAQRMSEYLRKSSALLVGIVNMKTDPALPMDLSAEQQLSRSLVHEARYLKHHMQDSRSARLVSDMEKVFIELANLDAAGDRPSVELIRGGIVQKNLLFKVRMAEAMFGSPTEGAREEVY